MTILSRIYFNAVYGALGGLLGWLLFGVFGEKNPTRDPVFLPAHVIVKVADQQITYTLTRPGEAPAEKDHTVSIDTPVAKELMGKKRGELVAIPKLGDAQIVDTYFLNWEHINWILGGIFIGGMIGYFVVSVEAIRDHSLIRFVRLASYGVGLGVVGGAIGMIVAENLNTFLIGLPGGDTFIVKMLARGLAWSLLGVAIGMSEGIAARSLGKFSYGTLGGALGGFVGGCLFMIFYQVTTEFGSTGYLGNALGLVVMGACIGSLSALVQAVFQPACVKVLRGWQEGREYPLDKPANSLGRDEHDDIALFRDMKVEKHHALIRRVQAKYVLINNGAPSENTLVNDAPVPQTRELQDGDKIQLGNILLRFQMRAALARARGRKHR